MNPRHDMDLLAKEVASRVQDRQRIGIGTGTTVSACLPALADRVRKEGLRVSFVATSLQTSIACSELNLTLCERGSCSRLDWSFDGVDQYDRQLRMIKGRGGAMLNEKLVASASDQFVVLATAEKFAERLGAGCMLPVECLVEARGNVEAQLERLGATSVQLRSMTSLGRQGVYFTERGNVIIDAEFGVIEDSLEQVINGIPGVIENGLFLNWADEILVLENGSIRSLKRS